MTSVNLACHFFSTSSDTWSATFRYAQYMQLLQGAHQPQDSWQKRQEVFPLHLYVGWYWSIVLRTSFSYIGQIRHHWESNQGLLIMLRTFKFTAWKNSLLEVVAILQTPKHLSTMLQIVPPSWNVHVVITNCKEHLTNMAAHNWTRAPELCQILPSNIFISP